MNLLVDRIRGMDKIVKWEFTPIVGCYALFKSYSATEDPNLESYTLERFGLKNCCRGDGRATRPGETADAAQETNNSADNQQPSLIPKESETAAISEVIPGASEIPIESTQPASRVVADSPPPTGYAPLASVANHIISRTVVFDVVHKHSAGSCRGQLQLGADLTLFLSLFRVIRCA